MTRESLKKSIEEHFGKIPDSLGCDQKLSQASRYNSDRYLGNTMRSGWMGSNRNYMRTSPLWQSKRGMAFYFSRPAQWNTIP